MRAQRKDGLWPVYIRVIHNRQVGYIKTDKIVSLKGVNKAGEVCDPYVVSGLSQKIIGYIDRLNREDTDDWSVSRMVQFLCEKEPKLTFSIYAHRVLDQLYNEGRLGTYAHRVSAVVHFEKFVGRDIRFQDITLELLTRWRASMKCKESTQMSYLCTIRKIYHDALDELTGDERKVLCDFPDPFKKFEIPRVRTNIKRAIEPRACRRFFAEPLTKEYRTNMNASIARDVCMLSFCLAGMNATDLYLLKKGNYIGGILRYNRRKTMGKRADKAYFEIRVPPILYPLFEKYAAPKDSEWLFIFYKIVPCVNLFASFITRAIRPMGEKLYLTQRLCFYSFRHTWATYAQNYCGASIGDVAFALNHTMKDQITRRYIKLNFEPVWTLNEKVIDFVFFQQDDEVEEERERKRHEYIITPDVEVHATIYYRGRRLGEVTDKGYHEEQEILAQLRVFIDDTVPQHCVLQYKIELETGASRVYSISNE